MDHIYRIKITKDGKGYIAECHALKILIEAGTPAEAVTGMEEMIRDRVADCVKKGNKIPDDDTIDIDGSVYVTCDAEKAFRIKYGGAVRRSVTIPAWMDEIIRSDGLDASKMLQDAISKKAESRITITNIKELKNSVDSSILDEYVREEVGKLLKGEEK